MKHLGRWVSGERGTAPLGGPSGAQKGSGELEAWGRLRRFLRPVAAHLPQTFLTPLLPRPVNVVLELDADLPLRGLVADEGELEELLSGRATQVGLDETSVDEVDELLGPESSQGSPRGRRSRHCPPRSCPGRRCPLHPAPRLLRGGSRPWPTYHFLDLSRGGGFRGMRKRARMGCISHRAVA